MSTKQKKARGINRLNGSLPDGATTVLDAPPALLKLDLGCGPNKREGFLGADSIDFPGVDFVTDLRQPWPWPDNSVEEAHSSHFVEHLEARERIHFCNELYRVLVPGGKCTVIVPHFASCRAYGDMTHKWPPVSEFWFYYLSKDWRLGNPAAGIRGNAPHNDASHVPWGYSCDFDAVWGYTTHPAIAIKNQEYIQHAWGFFKEAIQDIQAHLTAKK